MASSLNKVSRVLVCGSNGQLGGALISHLRNRYGVENVISLDLKRIPENDQGPFELADVTNMDQMKSIVNKYKPNRLIHFSALLSAVGEKNVDLALDVNVTGLRNVLTLARDHKMSIFVPSTIGAFGPTTPRDNTPDVTIQNPTTVYGVSKVLAERLGEYFHKRFDVDFRSLRYPGVISADSPPGGGTTDYAVDIFHEVLANNQFTSFLHSETRLPMMYLPDCINATLQVMDAPADRLKQRVYNVQAMSFTPKELAAELRRHFPDFIMQYKEGDFRQSIADSWPRSLDDSCAREQWGWKPEYDLPKMVDDMVRRLKEKKSRGIVI